MQDIESIRTQVNAKKAGFDNVLYLDSTHQKYLEEVIAWNWRDIVRFLQAWSRLNSVGVCPFAHCLTARRPTRTHAGMGRFQKRYEVPCVFSAFMQSKLSRRSALTELLDWGHGGAVLLRARGRKAAKQPEERNARIESVYL